jgi:hypothetical protein
LSFRPLPASGSPHAKVRFEYAPFASPFLAEDDNSYSETVLVIMKIPL